MIAVACDNAGAGAAAAAAGAAVDDLWNRLRMFPDATMLNELGPDFENYGRELRVQSWGFSDGRMLPDVWKAATCKHKHPSAATRRRRKG